MTVKEIPVNIRCLEYKQDRSDADYGSCLYARFYFNIDKYELSIISDCGSYGYQWVATPETESFLKLMSRISSDYLIHKLCGDPREFDYDATKANFYDYADDEDDRKRLDTIFEAIESNFVPFAGETFLELFERENDGWWCDAWNYLEYSYNPNQKKIVEVFETSIQPAIQKLLQEED